MATITEFLRIKYESTQDIEQTLKSLQIECLLSAIKKKTLHSKLFESLDNDIFDIQTSSQLAYSSPSCLLFHDQITMSECGIQQGDPLGPLLFALSVDHIARNLSSGVNFWYLDDVTIGGPTDVVMEDVKRITSGFSKIGLSLNGGKCELVNISLAPTALCNTFSSLSSLIVGLSLTPTSDLVILGSPISADGVEKALA